MRFLGLLFLLGNHPVQKDTGEAQLRRLNERNEQPKRSELRKREKRTDKFSKN